MLLVTDSNGSGLNLHLLKTKPTDKVRREYRYTTSEASTNIPDVAQPEKVTDVIFQVGLNDMRRGSSATEIRDSTLNMQLIYRKKFKNARQHITALPPLDDPHIKVNNLLQKLTQNTGSNFITTKACRDRNSGQMRQNLIRDKIHYNTIGIKTIAREMKKSLFSQANIGNDSLTILNNMQQSVISLTSNTQ